MARALHTPLRTLLMAMSAVLVGAGWAAEGGRSGELESAPERYRAGKTVYDYYCYQCHGYSGDGATESARYLEPAPRNFRMSDRERLSERRMIASVTNGRPGTAMTRFGGTLTTAEIDAVVHYVRESFMTDTPVVGRYHTEENGWNWQGEITAAPFVSGELPVDAPAEALTENQRAARRIFMASCVTCHRGRSSKREETFGLRAVSYPRGGFSHRGGPVDAVSGASVYRLHDRAPPSPDDQADRGRRLYMDNCAFCHAGDGSGRNWIGSFLASRPRNLTGGGPVCELPGRVLRSRIADGLAGTSMPAWKHVLQPQDIDAVARFVEDTLCATRIPVGPMAIGANR